MGTPTQPKTQQSYRFVGRLCAFGSSGQEKKEADEQTARPFSKSILENMYRFILRPCMTFCIWRDKKEVRSTASQIRDWNHSFFAGNVKLLVYQQLI